MHAPPILAAPATCSEPEDSDICRQSRHKCKPRQDVWPAFVELHRLPLRRRSAADGPRYQNGTHWSPHAAGEVRRCAALLGQDERDEWRPSFASLGL